MAAGTSTTSPRTLAGRLQLEQAAAQELRHQHAGHLVGVQGGLDVDLLAGAGRAEVEAAQLVGGVGVRGGDGVLVCAHGGRAPLWGVVVVVWAIM
ncbi:hypothetical protein [Rugamonas sp. DEMB1]|uniref:hypothetical protein n=1 Tax=Rugamonas sp. DEMB1 TaxID=3039386 RepID=UPI0028BD7DC1|nr:hypothetical protein [Rugamonas sp. DEMB1]